MSAVITAPAKLCQVSYSRNGNLKLQITDITPTTREEISKFGEEFILDRYEKLILDRVPAEDYLNDDGSLIEPEHMKDFLEYQNGVTLPQFPRALIPRVPSKTPRRLFSMIVYFKDPKEYERMMSLGWMRTPHTVAKIRPWSPPQKTLDAGPRRLLPRGSRNSQNMNQEDELLTETSDAEQVEDHGRNTDRPSGSTYYSCLEVDD